MTRITLSWTGGVLWLEPENHRPPTSPMRTASMAVAGGRVISAPAASRFEPPAAVIFDPDEAAGWLPGVYGDDVLRAVAGHRETFDATPGDLTLPVMKLLHARWLQRWWHPRGHDEDRLPVLAEDIATLMEEAWDCLPETVPEDWAPLILRAARNTWIEPSDQRFALAAGVYLPDEDRSFTGTVDWMQVPARSATGEESDIEVDIGGTELLVCVAAGIEPVGQLGALCKFSGNPFPVPMRLRLDGEYYAGGLALARDDVVESVDVVAWPPGGPMGRPVREPDEARRDRDHVRRVIANRLGETTPGSLACET